MLYGILEERLYRHILRLADTFLGQEDSVPAMVKREERRVIDAIINSVLNNNQASLVEHKERMRDVKVTRLGAQGDVDCYTDVHVVRVFSPNEAYLELTSLNYGIESVGIGKRQGRYFNVHAYGLWMPDSVEESIFKGIDGFLLGSGFVKEKKRKGSYRKNFS